jgi:hypothetical protein
MKTALASESRPLQGRFCVGRKGAEGSDVFCLNNVQCKNGMHNFQIVRQCFAKKKFYIFSFTNIGFCVTMLRVEDLSDTARYLYFRTRKEEIHHATAKGVKGHTQADPVYRRSHDDGNSDGTYDISV